MKEDNAVYDIYIYSYGELIKKHMGLNFWEAFEIYYQYDPPTFACADVYRDGVRLKFGEAMRKFYDPNRFVTLF